MEVDWGQSGGAEPAWVWMKLGADESILFDAVRWVDTRGFGVIERRLRPAGGAGGPGARRVDADDRAAPSRA